MHILQTKQTKLKPQDVEELMKKFNISVSQLPKIKIDDPSLPEGCQRGEVIEIHKKTDEETRVYYRVVA